MSRTMTKGFKEGVPSPLELNADLYLEGDQYVAECVELGTVSQGDTLQEAVDSLKEAVEGYLQSFPHALEHPKKRTTSYVERVRRMERAYSEMIGEPIEPVNVEELGRTKLVIDYLYA
jgi:predicted RNase H-like HicB family nuclease